MASGVTVNDNKLLRRKHATDPKVQAAIALKTEEIARLADAIFAPHDRPGGHYLETTTNGIDGTVSLVGPAAEAVEFGHHQSGNRAGEGAEFVKGLHILTKAAFGSDFPL